MIERSTLRNSDLDAFMCWFSMNHSTTCGIFGVTENRQVWEWRILNSALFFFCYKRQKTQNLINKLLSAFPVHDSEILVACKTAGCEPLKIKSCILKFTSYLANVSGIDFFSFPVINFHFYFQTPKSDKVAHWIKCQKYELFFYNSIYFGYYRTSLSCVWLNANGCPYLFPIWP